MVWTYVLLWNWPERLFRQEHHKPISLSAFVLWLPGCLLVYSPGKWGLLTKVLTDVWLQHSRERGCRDVTTLHQIPQKLNAQRWNSALSTTKNSSRSHCSVSRQLGGLSQLWNFCSSVKNTSFACARGGWQTLSIPGCCWDGGCLSPSRPQPVCQSTLPSSGDTGAQDIQKGSL